MPDVVILIPVLRRPDRVAPLVDQIASVTPLPHRVLFIASPGDRVEIAAIDATGADRLIMEADYASGDYSRKINAGMRRSDEPLMFLGADDLLFHAHWLERALDRLAPEIGVVGTNDLGNPRVMAGRHSTHSLVCRDYVPNATIDRSGDLLYEGYRHNFVDDELIAAAITRRAFAFASDSHVEHLHPHWAKGKRDEIYDLGQAGFAEDRQLFLTRRRTLPRQRGRRRVWR